MVLFIVAAAQIAGLHADHAADPAAMAELLVRSRRSHGTWLFLLLSIAILIVMGSVLEGAAALIIFGPLLMPVRASSGSTRCITAWCW